MDCTLPSDFEDFCNFYSCVNSVTSIQILPNSEWWELVQKNKNKAWMRISPCLDSLPTELLPNNQEVLEKFTQYYNEYRVYYNILRPLLTTSICPHFFKPLGAGSNCSVNSLLQYFGGNPNINDQLVRLRNVYLQMLTSTTTNDRVSLIPPDDTHIEGERHSVVQSSIPATINTLIIEQPNATEQPFQLEALWDTLFQVAIACYAMELCKLNHNMLQPRTVRVFDTAEPKKFYLVNNHCYQYEFPQQVFIYWFQNATSPQLQETGRFQPLKDFVTFCYSVVQSLKSQNQEERAQQLATEFASLLVNSKGVEDPLSIDEFNQISRSLAGGAHIKQVLKKKKLVSYGSTVKKKVNKIRELRIQLFMGLTILPKAWELMLQNNFFHSMENIIYLLSLKCKKCKLLENIPSEVKVYTLSKHIFDTKGHLKTFENNLYSQDIYKLSVPTVKELDKQIQKRKNDIQILRRQLESL